MMKKITVILIATASLILSCSGNQANADLRSGDEIIATSSGYDGGDSKTGGKPINLTKQDFLEKVMNYEKNTTEWVYEGELPALIDFYADWCGPCRIAAPVLEELASEYEGRIHIYKVDTEKERELAAVFGIQSIPAFLFVPARGRPTMSSGIARTPEETKEMFRNMIEELLLKPGKEL